MTTKIRQCGVIESINGTHARIQIVRSSACQTCEASNRCNIHSGKITYVDIDDQRLAKYKKGDRVLFNGSVYESLIDGNAYSPTAYPAGWKLIE